MGKTFKDMEPNRDAMRRTRHGWTPKISQDRCGATGKVILKSEDNALAALGDIQTNHRLTMHTSRRRESRAYQCHFCSLWHLTSETKSHREHRIESRRRPVA